MTYEKAYKECKEFFDNDGIGELDAIAFNMALNALEKQIPKKPHQEEFELGEYCPNCEYIFDGFPNYCEYCGQRIDWSDTE